MRFAQGTKPLDVVSALIENYSNEPVIDNDKKLCKYNLDSLDYLELAYELENYFGINIENPEIAGWRKYTAESLAESISKKISSQE